MKTFEPQIRLKSAQITNTISKFQLIFKEKAIENQQESHAKQSKKRPNNRIYFVQKTQK